MLAPEEEGTVIRAVVILVFLSALSGCESQTNCSQTDASCDAQCQDVAPTDATCEAGPQNPDPEAADYLRQIIEARRSIRDFNDEAISREAFDAILFSAQGITLPGVRTYWDGVEGFRAAPSAGATYPIELYVSVDRVEGIEPGLYRYLPMENRIESTGLTGALSQRIAEAGIGQMVLAEAAAIVIFTTVTERTADRYGIRANAYVTLEVGHAAQNVLLTSTAHNLGACAVGAFTASSLTTELQLPEEHYPAYMIPIGVPAQ